MRLLVASHACVVDINQTLYADLARFPDVQLTLVAPRRWKCDYGELRFKRLPELDATVVLGPAGDDSRMLGYGNRRARSIARQSQAELLLVEEEPCTLGAWQWCQSGLPFVFFSNENVSRERPFPHDGMERTVMRRAAGAVAQTEQAAAVLRKRGFAGPLEVIPYAVDGDRALPGLDLGLDRPVVVYAGRMWAGKGIFDLWSALERLPHCPWSALFVGDGPDLPELKKRVQRSGLGGRTRFTGMIAHRDVPAYVCASDLAVVPSRTTSEWTEQLSRSLQEALAWGVCVLASDSGSNRWQVESSGGGLVVGEGQVGEMALALERLLGDGALRSSLGRSGREGARKLFGRPAVAGRWKSFLNEVYARVR